MFDLNYFNEFHDQNTNLQNTLDRKHQLNTLLDALRQQQNGINPC